MVKNGIFQVATVQRGAPWIVGRYLKLFLVLSMYTSICHRCFLPKQEGFKNEQKSGIFFHCAVSINKEQKTCVLNLLGNFFPKSLNKGRKV